VKIRAIVYSGDDAAALELAEIDENLIHHKLTALEYSRAIARRKAIYLELHPETKCGGDRGNQHTGGKTTTCRSASFTVDTSVKTGRSCRSVERAATIGKDLTEEAAAVIVGTPLEDNASALAAIAKLPAEEQQSAAAVEVARCPPRTKKNRTAVVARTPRRKADTERELRNKVLAWLRAGVRIEDAKEIMLRLLGQLPAIWGRA
jgi:ParB family chromosome partitioning protein